MTPLIRPSRPSDMAFVFSSWSKYAYSTLTSSCHWSRQARAPLYTLFRPLFEGVMQRLLKTARVLVAVNPEDDEQIFGFLVYEAAEMPVVHFVAVKYDFQRRGIAKALFAAAAVALERPALYSLGILPRIVRGDHRSTARLFAPQAWTYVPYGLMP